MNDDEWHHVTVRYKKPQGLMSVYIDGAKVDEEPLEGPDDSKHIVRLGVGGPDSVKPFEGLMDNARFYNRPLPSTEVAQLAAGNPPAEGLTAFWTFDENQGTTARNSVGGGYDGTLKGGTWAPGKEGAALKFEAGDSVEIGLSKPSAPMIEFDFDAPQHGWRHVVLTYDGSSRASGFKLYVGGEDIPLKVEKDALSGPIETGAPITLGSRIQGQQLYSGLLDEFHVFDRVLIPEEIRVMARLAHIQPAAGQSAPDWKRLVELEEDYSEVAALLAQKPAKSVGARKRLDAMKPAAAGTRYAGMVNDRLGQLNQHRSREAKQVIEKLKRETSRMVRSKKYKQAADHVMTYKGALAEETRAERTNLARTWMKKGEDERAKKEASAKAAFGDFKKQVAEDILAGDRKACFEHIAAFRKKYPGQGDLIAGISNQIHAILHLPATVMDSFRKDVGKKVQIELNSGKAVLTVKEVQGLVLVGETGLAGGGKVEKKVTYKDLTPKE
ncbi:MAG: LamG-like jellyroll fold domain-containing protein, partial [Verrucomicrobiota bacterium]